MPKISLKRQKKQLAKPKKQLELLANGIFKNGSLPTFKSKLEATNHFQLRPYALEILDYLKQKYTLHIITNGFDKTQHIKLKHSNLTPYFNQIITSEKTGFKKPNPKIFEHALDLANAKDIESVYIGDNLVVDILACQNAGIDGMYFNPEKKLHKEKISFEISCLSQIMEIL